MTASKPSPMVTQPATLVERQQSLSSHPCPSPDHSQPFTSSLQTPDRGKTIDPTQHHPGTSKQCPDLSKPDQAYHPHPSMLQHLVPLSSTSSKEASWTRSRFAPPITTRAGPSATSPYCGSLWPCPPLEVSHQPP